MKKVISIMAFCCMLFAPVFFPVTSCAQSTMQDKNMKEKEVTVKMKDGKMMLYSNGAWTSMTTASVMSDGSKVSTNGTVTAKDGKTKMLKNGQCVKPDVTIK